MARSAILNVMVQAAMKAGRSLARDFGEVQNLQVSLKGPSDYVSQADRKAEEIVYNELSRARPGYSFLMEERGVVEGDDPQHRWIVDPLDGTTNYAHGLPVFGVSIALEAAGRLVLGVVYDPMRDEMFVGERGDGATLNDTPIRVSTTPAIGESLLATGFPYNIRETPDTNLREYAALSLRARAVRRLGSAVIDLAYVACGRFDGYWELRLGAWDVAAGAVLVEEAGGRITGIDGGPLEVDAPTLLATNGLIHDDLLTTLEEIRGG